MHIKINLVTLQILLLLGSLISCNNCPNILQDGPITYACNSPGFFDTSSGITFAPGTRTMNVAFKIKILSTCAVSADPYTFFALTLNPDGTERKIFSVTNSIGGASFYTEDTTGTLYPYSPIWEIPINTEVKVAMYVDLQFNTFYAGGIRDGMSTGLSIYSGPIDYGTWTFDSTTKLYLCSDVGGASSIQCEISDLKISYDGLPSTWGAFIFPLLGTAPILKGQYNFNEVSGTMTAADSTGLIGTANLGAAAHGVADTYTPSFVTGDGLDFTTSNNYLELPHFDLVKASGDISPSISVIMWVYIDSATTDGSYLFRYASSDLAYDRLGIVFSGGEMQWKSNSDAASFNTISLSTGVWQQVMASAFFASTTVTVVGASYTTSSKGYNDRSFTAGDQASNLQSTDRIIFGGPNGFIGKLRKIQIYTPGTSSVSSPTCQPTTCLWSIGLTSTPTCMREPCQSGTYEVGYGVCNDCNSKCATCTSATTCQTCKANYGLIGTMCNTCPSGSTIVNQKCCPANCVNCFNSTICLTCQAGYARINYVCTACPSGTFLNGMTCQACDSKCATCTSANTCQTCQPTYGLVGTMCDTCPSGTTLVGQTCQCNTGTYLSGQTCTNCDSKCATCTGATTCQTCKANYGLIGTMCDTCPSGSTLVGQTCQCNTGTYLSGQTCTSCDPKCATCTDATTCQTCQANYGLIGTMCDTCPSGSTLVGQTCQCDAGTYLSGQTCTSCDSKCATCTDATTCQTCKEGYVLQGTMCDNHLTVAESKKHNIVATIVGSVVGGVASLSVVGIIVYLVKFKKVASLMNSVRKVSPTKVNVRPNEEAGTFMSQASP